MGQPSLGELLRALRKRHGFANQRSFAKAAGLPQATIADLESGATRSPRLETLSRFAEALRIPVHELIDGSDPLHEEHAETDGAPAFDAIRVQVSDCGDLDLVAFEPAPDLALLRVITGRLRPLLIGEGDLLVVEIGGNLVDGAVVAYAPVPELEQVTHFMIRRRLRIRTSGYVADRLPESAGFIGSKAPFTTIIYEGRGLHRAIGPVIQVLRRLRIPK